MIRWALIFQIVFIFCRGFPRRLFENAVKSSFGVEAGIERNAQQGQPFASRILHFPGHLADAVFINEFSEVFLQREINNPG